MARQYLYQPKESGGFFPCQLELEDGSSPLLHCQQEQNGATSLLQYIQEPEEVSPVLRYLQHPEEFPAFHQQLPQPKEEVDTSVQQLEAINPVLQYLQQLEEMGNNLLQRDSCIMSSFPVKASRVENVTQVKLSGAVKLIYITFSVVQRKTSHF